jgi:HK97 family phage major capsid protein
MKTTKAEIAAIVASANAAGLRQLDPAAQLRAIRGQKVERTFTVDRENGIDQNARTAWLSIASEEPYERWWGIEILDLRKASIRDARLKAGAALLVGHDTADQVGVVESYEITADKKLRVLARFGRSARAEEIWQDVLDGIRRNTSVGYVIHDLVLEKSEEGSNTYRVISWEPLEASIVPVPADYTVGVGRAHETAEPAPEQPTTIIKDTMDNEQQTAAANKAAQDRAVQEAVLAEQKRVSDLQAAGKNYKANGGEQIAADLIADPKGSLDQFREKMLAKLATKGAPTPTAEPHEERPASYGSGARQIIRHGVLRAFRKPIHFTDGSKMDPVESAYRAGQWLLATVGQNQRAQRWCRDHGMEGYMRVMTTDVDSAGGYIVPDEMEQSIIDLREDYGLARKLCRRRPMASDTKSVPKRSGGVTAYFVNEDNSGVTASDKAWASVNLVAKTLAALSLVSKNLEEDSIIDVVDDLAMEMAYAFATKEDQCWLVGDGTSTYGGMQGLVTLMEATAYTSKVTAASGHDTFAEYDNADLSSVMAAVADFPGINPVWVCSKTFAENVFGRLKRVAGGNSGSDLDKRARYGYGGYDAYTSEIMPKVGTSDATGVEALFGDFSMSSSFGDRRGIMVEVLRERYAEKLQVGVLAHERFQVVNHDLGTTAIKGPVAALDAH